MVVPDSREEVWIAGHDVRIGDDTPAADHGTIVVPQGVIERDRAASGAAHAGKE